MSEGVPARVIESKVIVRQPGRYIGWPTMAKTPTGELLAVFSGDRDAHVCPFGKTFLVRSPDAGATWSEPELVGDTPLDDRDAGVLACRDGTVIVSWFTSHFTTEAYLGMCPEGEGERWRRHLAAITPATVDRWAGGERIGDRQICGHWIRRSADCGRTWGESIRVPPMTPHGPIELHDGRLFFLGVGGRVEPNGREPIIGAESRDGGRTWSVVGEVSTFPPYPGESVEGFSYLCEPHVVETEPGRLLGMARYEERPHERGRTRSVLWTFTSDDIGRTWTEPEPTRILGKPPHLLRLSDGRILATYGYRHEPYGERAVVSADGGRTWGPPIVLRDDAPNGDLGYPVSVELDEGTMLTVYYQVDKPGEKTCLMTTHWGLTG